MANSTSPGPGVDAQGRPVVDPTENVKALTEAAVARLDDLRTADTIHLRELMELRAYYDGLLRQAETARIDAIRAVDVGNVQRAAEVAAAQAEALRNQVAAAATASQTSLAAALDPIQKDIADLRRAQYEAQGKQGQVVEARAGTGALYAAAGLGVSILLALLAVVGVLAAR
jgi:hypothetical protein